MQIDANTENVDVLNSYYRQQYLTDWHLAEALNIYMLYNCRILI